MKHKIIQLISIILTTALLWQGVVWAKPDIYALRPRPAAERQDVARESVKFPLTAEFIHSLNPIRITNDDPKGREIANKLASNMPGTGFTDRIGEYLIPDSLITSGSVKFSLGRLEINCFKVADWHRDDNNTYIFSITSANDVVGHGVIQYIPKEERVIFRYAIHGGRFAQPDRNFRRQGYGKEALVLIMAMCVDGRLFEGTPKVFQLGVHRQQATGKFLDTYMLYELCLPAGFVLVPSGYPEFRMDAGKPDIMRLKQNRYESDI